MLAHTALVAALAASTALAMAPQSPSGVVINELNYDDSGSDDFEFVELYNGSTQPVDISNWTLNGIDGTTSGNGTHTIGPGVVLQPGGFWVVGDAGVPNVNEVISGLALENGADGVYLWPREEHWMYKPPKGAPKPWRYVAYRGHSGTSTGSCDES